MVDLEWQDPAMQAATIQRASLGSKLRTRFSTSSEGWLMFENLRGTTSRERSPGPNGAKSLARLDTSTKPKWCHCPWVM